MDISGLVYRNDHSASSTSSSSRGGVMAPHMPMEAQPFVQDHMGSQMGNFSPYSGQFGFDASHVQQYQHSSMGVMGHPQTGFAGSPYSHHQQDQQQHHQQQQQQQQQHTQHHGSSQLHHNQQSQQHQGPLPPTLATQRQAISRDTGQLGRTSTSLRVSTQKPTVSTQQSNYAYHTPSPHSANRMSPQIPRHHDSLQPRHHQHIPQHHHPPQHSQHSPQHPHTPQQSQTHIQLIHQPTPRSQPQPPPQPPPQPTPQQQQLDIKPIIHHDRHPQQVQQQQQQQKQTQQQQQTQATKHQSPRQVPLKVTHRVGTTKVKSPNADVNFQTDVDNLMKAIQAKAPKEEEEVKNTPSPAYPQHHSPYPKLNSPPKEQSTIPRMMYNNSYMNYTPGAPSTPIPTPQPVEERDMVEVKKQSSSEAGSPTESLTKEEKKAMKPKKRYECEVAGCHKSFFQKTHLDIHSRAHTGDKPFVGLPCRAYFRKFIPLNFRSEPGCGQRFSQLGNLKTHERRHTGEKPYSCDACGKRFAQRGNVRAHKIVHDGAKPFTCRLDGCNKQFTQLGNLKSHQNKFHITALRNLTEKFASIQNPEEISTSDREVFEYFAELYKNSNRGIKGRGKDRKISGSSKKVRLDTALTNGSNGNADAKQNTEMQIQTSTSPNGSSEGYDFASSHMDEDDEGSTIESPFEQPQQLPPMRPDMGALGMGGGGGGGIGGFQERPMVMHTHIAKYHLDRKFQS